MNAPRGSVSTHQNVTTCQAIVASCFDFTGKRNKVVYSDMHVAYGSLSSRAIPYPKQCSKQGLLPQAKAFAFLLYNTTTCSPELQ